VPGNFPHNLRAQRLLARQIKSEKLTLQELDSLMDAGTISALSTELETRKALGLKTRAKSGKSDSAATISELATILSAATDAEMKAALRTREIGWLLRVLPEEWLGELQARVRMRALPHLIASEGLRRALSLVKTADAASTTSAAAAGNEQEALTVLRQLNVVLSDFGTDEITIVRQYVKENRCAKRNRRRKSHSRRRAA
jgi:hypothetical protein